MTPGPQPPREIATAAPAGPGDGRRTLRLIVNADDLGMSVATNDAIERCIVNRTITSTSILANAPAFEEAIGVARRNPHVSYGVHLNITEFSPISGAGLGLLVSGGVFQNNAHKVRLNSRLIAAIGEEFAAQIARVQSSGVHVSHFDSHHHTHTMPSLFLAVVGLARSHGIRYVRQSSNLFSDQHPLSTSRRIKKGFWNSALGWAGIRRTDYFGSLLDFQSAASTLPDRSCVEIMVHPGGAGSYPLETELLDTPWWEADGITPVWETYRGPV